jgi:hypothetical protein
MDAIGVMISTAVVLGAIVIVAIAQKPLRTRSFVD